MGELDGRIAVVTGASRGIGRAIAVALARNGARVVVNYTANEAAAGEAVEAVRAAGGNASAKRFDVADAAAVDAAFKEIVAAEGGLHILVNNAGIAVNALMLGAKDADWKRSIDVNLNGTFHCVRAALRSLMKAKDAGRIINITSITGEVGSAGQGPYVAAKAGVIGLTKTLALEYAKYGVTVNAIAPGPVMTAMLAGVPDAIRERIIAQVPVGRIASPDEIAGVHVFLASDEASFITGQVIFADGGMSVGI